jgi:outer membrane protein OmpA-like peptidoglycan-associated protein
LPFAFLLYNLPERRFTVSDSNPKDFPPDDFGMTTPGIRMPKSSYPSPQPPEEVDDWAKTNYNFSPKQSPPADEWGKTAVNINVPRSQPPEDEFGKTFIPGGQPRGGRGKDADWGATQTNINVPRYDRGEEDFGGGRREAEYKSTMPYFQLPEAERAKYQNLPPGASAAGEAKQDAKKGGVPTWLWATAGLGGLFIFSLAMIGLIWYFFSPKNDFELIVKGAPEGSDIFVDGLRWNLTSADGSYELRGLRVGEIKTIEIRRAGFECKPQQIQGERGVPRKEMVAQCTQKDVKVTPPPDDCANIKKGDFAKAGKCANDALDRLKDPIDPAELLKAMNLYIINFPTGKYEIVRPEDKAFIQKAAGYIQKLKPGVVIEVGGHTDNVGSKASNQVLSDNRAKSVRDALVAAGVNPSMLTTRGYGDSKPKASNDTDDGKFQNRRIEYSAIIQ